MQPRIAVIIVCHNAEADLARCLHALDAGTLRPALIVLVDSGSDSAAYLEGFAAAERSEERRVGKECRSRWSPYH